ncbi:DNA repair exonuclease SbcCD nuclease subunit [Rhizobium sp. BK181]|uniref:metallophosphoesterase family protein n=1 Tax=Rhizobium sp. BK181 TaxID=2587072 RepID=UPI00161CF6C6|nr:DNA repair exonuclease [Rhizobium sp. BK181]MBB3319820.1 DNA repair exonuclease SbcCD nuclease subunit [Rhizobium sp. BK181]
MAYRFVHTADIHLDSPLRTLALRNPELSDLIGLATRRTFIRIVDLCLEEQVDALLLAGDLYDGEQTSMKTARFLAEQLRRLDEAGIQTFIIRGNHDALSKITSELVMPESVKIFGSQAEAVAVHRGAGQFPVVIHGLSFAKPHAPQSLLRHYPMPVPDAVNIGIMHTSLGGSEGHDRYAPCNLADLHQSGFRYWALGHIHKRSVAEGAASTVVMPGMPQGRDINEDGPKSVSLVTIRDDRSVIVDERCINVAQFERLFIDVSDVADWKAMIGKVSGGLERLRSTIPADHLVARIQLHGSHEMAWRIRRELDLIRTELETRGSASGTIWIDKVHTSCIGAEDTEGNTGSALSELTSIINADVLGSAAYQQEIAAIADELRGQLPPELRNIFGTDETAFQDVLAGFAQEGSANIVALLRNTQGE